ncbi:hypothetical protein PGT21_026137 [Puccinia graminis f. sp. tritici]|uniref:Uncharacterized protein n=1 Tax=Puccinia graminis f. sp. tritici TaxID=56615 RepID=A0A5B0MCW0_PUCGR|nr:hypothetical protein PGT21_026137 [Puccinia graminis f. sp. tritici]
MQVYKKGRGFKCFTTANIGSKPLENAFRATLEDAIVGSMRARGSSMLAGPTMVALPSPFVVLIISRGLEEIYFGADNI